jgi:hypothetical protein
MPFSKPIDQSNNTADPLHDYLGRPARRSNKLERLDALLRQVNLEMAIKLEEPPPQKKGEN